MHLSKSYSIVLLVAILHPLVECEHGLGIRNTCTIEAIIKEKLKNTHADTDIHTQIHTYRHMCIFAAKATENASNWIGLDVIIR